MGTSDGRLHVRQRGREVAVPPAQGARWVHARRIRSPRQRRGLTHGSRRDGERAPGGLMEGQDMRALVALAAVLATMTASLRAYAGANGLSQSSLYRAHPRLRRREQRTFHQSQPTPSAGRQEPRTNTSATIPKGWSESFPSPWMLLILCKDAVAMSALNPIWSMVLRPRYSSAEVASVTCGGIACCSKAAR